MCVCVCVCMYVCMYVCVCFFHILIYFMILSDSYSASAFEQQILFLYDSTVVSFCLMCNIFRFMFRNYD